MTYSIQQVAAVIRAGVTGDSCRPISGVASFEDAATGDICFADGPAYLSRLNQSRAAAVIIPQDHKPAGHIRASLLRVSQPRLAFFELVRLFHPVIPPVPGISPLAVIGDHCRIGAGVTIEPFVVIRDHVTLGDGVHLMPHVYVGDHCSLGDHCVIKPQVTLMDRTRLGCHVIIHSGSVIGSDGYGFARDQTVHTKLTHTGHVVIGDHAEIGACNTIDRGTLGATVIGNGVKTDNQVHIAHNVRIGDHTLIVAQAGIAGSTTVGRQVIIAGKAGISGHLTIGDQAIVGPMAGVSASVPPHQVVSGIPHMPHKTWLKVANIISRLPRMRTELSDCRKRIETLENRLKEPNNP